MIGAVIENLIAGFVRPRRSVRRLLNGRYGMTDAMLLVILSYLIGAILSVLFPEGSPVPARSLFGTHLLGLLLQFISFFIISSLVYLGGRMFGGQGSRRDAYLTIAWYSLVTSLIAPLTLPARAHLVEAMEAARGQSEAIVEFPPGALALFMAASGIMLWLFSCYVAELHRFRRTWNVLAVILGLSVAVSLIVALIVPPR